GVVVMRDGLLRLVERHESISQVVLRVGVVRIELNRGLEMGERLVHLADLEQGNAECGVNGGIIRIVPKRLLEMRDGLGRSPLLVKGLAEVFFRDSIVGGDSEGMRPKRFAIPPISRLGLRTKSQKDQHARGKRSQDESAVPP